MAKLTSKNALICLAAAAFYFLLSLQYQGPAYLADEIGYLANAAFIAGHPSDGASSYYAGFSFLMAPLFYFFSSAHDVWVGILAANGLMWGGTLFVVSLLLTRLMPAVPAWRIGMALIVVAMYPAFLAMSGYAFSQTAFGFVFSCAAIALCRFDPRHVLSVLPHALLTGYLCWVHPVGLSVAVASCIAVFFASFRSRRFLAPVLNAAVVFALAWVYLGLIRPWMIDAMTPMGGSANLHYRDASLLLREGISPAQMKTFFGMLAGQTAYLIIATFGFIVVGASWCLRQAWDSWRILGKSGSDRAPTFVLALTIFLVLAVVGIILETTFATILGTPDRFDHWIYGRYVEPVIALLFGIGLVNQASRTLALASSLFVVLAGAWLVHGVGAAGPLYVMNVPAWWPSFTGLGSSPVFWFVIGGLGVMAAALLNRVLASVLIMVAFAYCASAQRNWHLNILTNISNPSSIPDFVSQNYGSDQCVGFDQSSASLSGLPEVARERSNMYSFYLFDSPMLRMSPQAWFERCSGPLLTFNGDLSLPGVEYVGRETASNLYVVARKGVRPLRYPTSEPGEQSWKGSQSEQCLLSGCFKREGQALLAYHLVGQPSESGIRTDGRAGYLVYGPYASMAKGNYVLELKGDFKAADGASLDIVSGESTIYPSAALAALVSTDRKIVRLPFYVPTRAKALEVRILVSAADEMSIESYEIKDMDPFAEPELQKGVVAVASGPSIQYGPAELAQLPHQVGAPGRSGMRSDGRAGFLLYGPYRKIPAGRYKLRVLGDSESAGGSWIDVASGKGRKTHFRMDMPVDSNGGDLVGGEFTLDADVDDLEIRVFVTANGKVNIAGYSLKPSL